MVIATDVLSKNHNQEQMTDNVLDEIKENAFVNTNPLSPVEKIKVKHILPNTNSPNGITTISVGVGRDVHSASNPIRQKTTDSIKTDQYEYTGDKYAEKKHGKGVLSWSDGRMYTGAFFADKRHGFGIYHTPDISEFKGLYCHDERFGPGILIYKFLESADVGLWLSEALIRLLYSHPKLQLDIQITDKKSRQSSSSLIPSWYSPQELLTTISGLNLSLPNRSSTIFCEKRHDENFILTKSILEHADRISETMHEKRTQLDAYLTSIYEGTDEKHSQDEISRERKGEITSPNETHEQQQLFDYVNKFWPLKQQALFPIDEIISNTRSSFPNPGPIENGSLNLFEFSFNGKEKEVRDLLLQRVLYVDVCDSQGLTALHFATYNAHINVINTLLDFGGNVNQLSDDGLTSLALAFLLYYGNNPYETMNGALEHVDPIVINPRTTSIGETSSLILSSKQNLIQSSSYLTNDSTITNEMKLPSIRTNDFEQTNSYGFRLTNELRDRIQDEQFRQSVHSVIVLLLRRGADPSISDWPLPVLALAVRAGDERMVRLLLKNKAQVNCQLNSTRHASLTPLHIACGCPSSTSIDIARQLLENGANVNARSLAGNKEYLSLIDPLIIDANKINEVKQYGRTPLHIACTRDETADTLNLVRLLLEYQANPNAVCNGQTPLSLAIVLGNESLVDLLLNHQTTDPSTPLGLGNGNALCAVLSTFHETQWTYAKRLELIDRLVAKSPKVLYPIRFGPKNTLGTSIDFAYYMYNADTRISQTPYHALTVEERTTFGQRKELLAYIAKRFREEASKYEEIQHSPTPISDHQRPTSSPVNFFSRNVSSIQEKPSNQLKIPAEFRFCVTCGRSSGVRLTICKRCQKISFCSKACKITGWNQFHRYECRQLTSPITTIKTFTSRDKDLPNFNRVISLTTPPRPNNKNRLPPLTVAKLLRQQRLKNREKETQKLATTLNGIQLSWNSIYQAPENYSFN